MTMTSPNDEATDRACISSLHPVCVCCIHRHTTIASPRSVSAPVYTKLRSIYVTMQLSAHLTKSHRVARPAQAMPSPSTSPCGLPQIRFLRGLRRRTRGHRHHPAARRYTSCAADNLWLPCTCPHIKPISIAVCPIMLSCGIRMPYTCLHIKLNPIAVCPTVLSCGIRIMSHRGTEEARRAGAKARRRPWALRWCEG